MRLLGVLASFSAVIGLAVPAHADARGYLAELDENGVSYSDPDVRPTQGSPSVKG
jgi:hypothetical protein